jgi:hypothetical protein
MKLNHICLSRVSCFCKLYRDFLPRAYAELQYVTLLLLLLTKFVGNESGYEHMSASTAERETNPFYS